jgi:hypothetical protein
MRIRTYVICMYEDNVFYLWYACVFVCIYKEANWLTDRQTDRQAFWPPIYYIYIMHACIQTYILTRARNLGMCTYIRETGHMYIHVHMYVCTMCICTYVHMQVCEIGHMYIHVQMYVCTYAGMQTFG